MLAMRVSGTRTAVLVQVTVVAVVVCGRSGGGGSGSRSRGAVAVCVTAAAAAGRALGAAATEHVGKQPAGSDILHAQRPALGQWDLEPTASRLLLVVEPALDAVVNQGDKTAGYDDTI